MKKRFVAVIVAMLMAIPLLFITAGPASASCVYAASTKTDYASVLDDELRGYVKFYSTIHYYDCGNYRIFRWVRIGYDPDLNHNSTLQCGSSPNVIYHVRMNLGSIAGNNPGAWEEPCYYLGNYHDYDFPNVTYWDWEDWGGDARCAGTAWTAVINNWPDVSGSIPQNCF